MTFVTKQILWKLFKRKDGSRDFIRVELYFSMSDKWRSDLSNMADALRQ